MKIGFRTDAGYSIGSGHVMRDLTFADALARRGAEIRFFCREIPGNMADVIMARGYACTLLPDRAADTPPEQYWTGDEQREDAACCLDALSEPLDWLIVDHYGLAAAFEAPMRRRASRILIIDDLANRDHDADVLLDCNLSADNGAAYRDRVSAHCRYWLGPRFALLRPDFNAYRVKGLDRRGQCRRLLLFFGGMDPDNITTQAVKAVIALREAGEPVEADVVLGASNPHRKMIDALCAKRPYLCLHIQTPVMAELMTNADLALGAGGGSHWERCMLCLPALVCTLAENQVPTTRMLTTLGACQDMGPGQYLTSRHWYQAIRRLDSEILCRMSRAAGRVLNEQDGCHRVVNALLAEERHAA